MKEILTDSQLKEALWHLVDRFVQVEQENLRLKDALVNCFANVHERISLICAKNDAIKQDFLFTPISDVEMSTRLANVLFNAKIQYIYQLALTKAEVIQRWKNCGRRSIMELKDILAKFGLYPGIEFSEVTMDLIKNFEAAQSVIRCEDDYTL